MTNRDCFSSFHPMVNFVYFALVLVCSMCWMHPVSLAISLGSAFYYGYYLRGKGAVRFTLRFLLPLAVMVAIINPAFNHQGATILAYLPSGNPLTLESIVYGLASTAMLVAVLQWFACYSAVMTSDKFIYLFGRIIPALSLVLSMTLRFVPKFKNQLSQVQEAQKALGRPVGQGSLLQRLRQGVSVVSILVTWSLENAIETADSMKSRGYGLPHRTAFSIYTWQERDWVALGWLVFCGWYLGCGWAVGAVSMGYYPLLSGAPITPFTVSVHGVYLLMCLTPMLVNKQEDSVWKKMISQE